MDELSLSFVWGTHCYYDGNWWIGWVHGNKKMGKVDKSTQIEGKISKKNQKVEERIEGTWQIDDDRRQIFKN